MSCSPALVKKKGPSCLHCHFLSPQGPIREVASCRCQWLIVTLSQHFFESSTHGIGDNYTKLIKKMDIKDIGFSIIRRTFQLKLLDQLVCHDPRRFNTLDHSFVVLTSVL
jgi:hypothetical protein